MNAKRHEELQKLIEEEHLNQEDAQEFIRQSFIRDVLKPPANSFVMGGAKRKQSLIKALLEKLLGLVC